MRTSVRRGAFQQDIDSYTVTPGDKASRCDSHKFGSFSIRRRRVVSSNPASFVPGMRNVPADFGVQAVRPNWLHDCSHQAGRAMCVERQS
jgi:hypothetical protein